MQCWKCPLGIHVLSFGRDECTSIVDARADAPMSGSNTRPPRTWEFPLRWRMQGRLWPSDELLSASRSMAYCLPANVDLEDYLRKVLRKRGAYRDENGEIVVYDKPTILSWDDCKCEPDTGCLRKLWGLSTQVAKRHLERLAGEVGEGKTKITLAHAQELEDKAVETGMPEATSDRERPSLHTLSKVQATFVPN